MDFSSPLYDDYILTRPQVPVIDNKKARFTSFFYRFDNPLVGHHVFVQRKVILRRGAEEADGDHAAVRSFCVAGLYGCAVKITVRGM